MDVQREILKYSPVTRSSSPGRGHFSINPCGSQSDHFREQTEGNMMKKKKVDNFVKVEVVENMHGGRGRGEQGRYKHLS